MSALDEQFPSDREPPRGERGRDHGSASRVAEGRGRPTYELSFAAVLAVFLRHWRVVIGVPLVAALLCVVISVLLPSQYTSSAIFTPTSRSGQLSQLAGLAAQFGVNVPQGEVNESPDFYADLIRSRELLRSTVTTTYTFPESSDPSADTLSADLVELLGVGGDGRQERIEKAIEELRDHISVSADASTGVVTVDVTTRWAGLSRGVGQRLLDLVNEFNLETRQSQATAERSFLEDRVRNARSDLRDAEDSLQLFLDHNRSYQNSPELQFQYDRLQRRVSLQQQVYSSLAQSLEQAKIDEVRDTPVVTVVEPPQAPARPDSRHLILRTILALVLGGVVALVWVFGSEWVRRARDNEPRDFQELEGEWARARRDLRRFLENARGRFGGRREGR